jgi:hypothetical protein
VAYSVLPANIAHNEANIDGNGAIIAKNGANIAGSGANIGHIGARIMNSGGNSGDSGTARWHLSMIMPQRKGSGIRTGVNACYKPRLALESTRDINGSG